MRIATWNVNSVKARVDLVVAWLTEVEPDVLCLQELKCEDQAFPCEAFEALGYNITVHGQKTYNGVAVLSKRPFDEVKPGLPGAADDAQARYLETVVAGVRIASIYLPNGNPVETEKYRYKLSWMDRLTAHVRGLLALEEPLVLAGDYNVIPMAIDAKEPDNWGNDALFRLETRAKYRALTALGLTDALRAADPTPGLYTFWDYQAGSWQKNNGIRIDHCLLSCQAADRLRGVRVDKHVRSWDRPSDHVPVVVELSSSKGDS